MTFVNEWGNQTWAVLVEAAPWLLGGFVLAGLIHVLVPIARVTRALGRDGLVGVFKAALLGIPLPLCSCSVIPVAASIRRQGASRGAFVSFLISTPETGVDSIAISYALLGPVLAIVRPVAAFVTAIIAGVLVGRDGVESGELAAESPGDGCGTSCGCETPSADREGSKLVAAIRYGLGEMLADLSPWLVTGFALAGVAAALIPVGFVEAHIGAGPVAMLLMLVVGLPMYVCATSSTPIAAALIARGLSPGAALVFLLAGPATNAATVLVVSRDLGRRGAVVYVATIAVVAVVCGLVVDALVAAGGTVASPQPTAHEHSPTLFATVCAVVLVVLTIKGLVGRLSGGSKKQG